MGGRRYSQLLLERERAEKLQLVQQIGAIQGTIEGYRHELDELLATSTAGIRETFGEQVEAAISWMDSNDKFLGQTVDVDRPLVELQQIHEKCSEVAIAGGRLFKDLGVSFTKVGDEMARDLAHRIVCVRERMAAHRTACARWFADRVDRWPSLLQTADLQFDEESYGQLQDLLDSIEAEVEELARRSDELTARQQTRLYLLKAVRQVCCNLGMRETASPRYERRDDASSRILFTVASPDRGEIAFALSFDGIRTEAQPGRCLTDLEKLSSFLSAQYGIGTSFQERSEGTDPQSKYARARALPEDSDVAAEAEQQ